LCELHARIFPVGDSSSHRCNLFVRRDNPWPRTVYTQLGFGLTQGAFRAFNGELELSRIDLNQNLTGADFLAEFGIDGCNRPIDFAADANLIGGYQTSRKIDDSLNRYSLGGRALDLNGFGTASGATLSTLPSALILLLGISTSVAALEDEENDKHR